MAIHRTEILDFRDIEFCRRFMPLPGSIRIDWSTSRELSDIEPMYRLPENRDDDLRWIWIEESLAAFCAAEGTTDFLIEYRLDPKPASGKLESYRIEPITNADSLAGFTVSAGHLDGLVSGTYTLRQLFLRPVVPPPSSRAPDTAHGTSALPPPTLPSVTIVDAPAISERGQWGGNTHDEMPWTSQWKLNVIEESAGITYAGDDFTLRLSQDYIDAAMQRGVKIVPYIPHLEQIAKIAGLLTNTDIISTPDPGKPLPAEYVPGLCMSSEATRLMIETWISRIAELDHISSIEIWLSEDASPCYCDECRETDPFVLEMRCIQAAFQTARARRDDLRLRILLTQGSYPVNHLILEEASKDTEIVYYDGGRTYDSSHDPMIYPLLETYSTAGSWLGVYPQITHCWRTVFPYTAPQLIAFRAREFAGKQLEQVVGYAVPSNRHHEFNVAALAEWSWNPQGRTPREFAAAYATIHGFPDPEAFAAWAEAAGEAGWWLAESRLFLRLCYDYRFLENHRVTIDHRYELSGLRYDRATIEDALETAIESVHLAKHTGVPRALLESTALRAALEALLYLDDIITHLNTGNDGHPTRILTALEGLDRNAGIVSNSVSEWGEEINREMHGEKPYTCMMRMRDTANVLYRLGDAMRTLDVFNRLPDEYAQYREHGLTEWKRSSFDDNHLASFEFELTHEARKSPGVYFLCLTYSGGNCGGRVTRLDIVSHRAGEPGSGTVVSESVDALTYIGKWEQWHDVKIIVPEGEVDCRYTLRFELSVDVPANMDDSRWDYRGTIGLRRAMPALK